MLAEFQIVLNSASILEVPSPNLLSKLEFLIASKGLLQVM